MILIIGFIWKVIEEDSQSITVEQFGEISEGTRRTPDSTKQVSICVVNMKKNQGIKLINRDLLIGCS